MPITSGQLFAAKLTITVGTKSRSNGNANIFGADIKAWERLDTKVVIVIKSDINTYVALLMEIMKCETIWSQYQKPAKSLVLFTTSEITNPARIFTNLNLFCGGKAEQYASVMGLISILH